MMVDGISPFAGDYCRKRVRAGFEKGVFFKSIVVTSRRWVSKSLGNIKGTA
tara:strand:+ start:167 stop:319 length:153 start_codon:yes stop_codon:yes gene_type:complete